MARPKLSDDERRTQRVTVYLRPTELDALRGRAAAARLTVPEYLRQRALLTRLRIESPRRLAAAEFREVARLGSNLNQIARRLNQGGSAPQDTPQVLGRLIDLLERLLPEADD